MNGTNELLRAILKIDEEERVRTRHRGVSPKAAGQ